MIILDTNVAILLRDGDPEVSRRIPQRRSRIALALPTVIELEGGVYRGPDPITGRRDALNRLLRRAEVLTLDLEIVSAYGQIVAARGFSRPKIIDRLIAATAIVNDLTLVTINGEDFCDIPDLSLEIWPAPVQ